MESNDPGLLSFITRVVRRCAPRWLDAENLAVGVWIESQLKCTPVFAQLIRWRVWTEVAKAKRERNVLLKFCLAREEKRQETTGDPVVILSAIARDVSLTEAEQVAIYLKFYKAKKLWEIARDLHSTESGICALLEGAISKLRAGAERAGVMYE